ncbi:AbiV family abortive infection protein [Sulfurimonas sp. C5]|uniref:AbiV family abortive infection protein n=1 Tax=Sulfurimonas sp. C5 TaxID=3036947 RepID=UPI002456E5E3|nr:AbiV family abortive infection protein [Sulfurimonas sp. C5]MDH4943925.1 AbiV family abortive infection protein [Sulfurimonas sp. C5]
MEKKGFHIAHEASLVVSDEYTGLHGSDEYNAAVTHVYDLIRASYTLFRNSSFAPSLFLSITVFEEIAKIKAGHMRAWGTEREKVKRGKDPLFNHGKKHKISVDPIYLIGDRIANSIGAERAKEIFDGYELGKYSSLREESLYFSRTNKGLHIPAQKIELTLAAEHLLIAIEIFIDEFWGMTAEASEICDITDELYSEVEAELKSS